MLYDIIVFALELQIHRFLEVENRDQIKTKKIKVT